MSNIKRYGNGWEQTKLGNLGTFIRGRGIPKRDLREEGVPCILYGEIYTTYNTFTSKLKSRSKIENLEKSPQIKFGDILFATSGETRDEIGKHVMYLGEETAIAGGDILVFRPKDEIKNLAYSYVLATESIRKQKYQLAEGHSVVHLYQEHLSNLKVPLIPKDEQQKIASILFTWDEAIKLYSKLIELKKQKFEYIKKTLLIERKVRGSKRQNTLRDLIDIQGGYAFRSKDYSQKGVPIIRISNIKDKIFVDDDFVFHKDDNIPDRFIVKKGDILISMSGSIGRVGVYMDNEISCLNQRVGKIVFKNQLVDEDYLRFFMQTQYFVQQLERQMTTSALSNINSNHIKNISIYLPKLDEQILVSGFLSQIEKEIFLLEKLKEELQEQKRGLMQLLLTGKVRV